MKTKLSKFGLCIFLLLLVFELFNISIDTHNKIQLKAFKSAIENINLSSKFLNINEFNSLANTSIKPLLGCYYISSENGEFDYIFWYKNHSLLFKYLNKDFYSSYPEYSISSDKVCLWKSQNNGDDYSCYDRNKEKFISTINNSCK